MRRALVHTAVWALATGAAIALSWFGVHSVLAGTAYDPPRTLPIAGPPSGGPQEASMMPESSSTHRPRPSDSPAASRPGRSASPTPSGAVPPRGSTPSARPSATPSAAPLTAGAVTGAGSVHSYEITGGRVALSLGASSASLISATPDAGWSMQVWNENGWIRVDFSSGTTTSTLYCTWNGHPPQVQTYQS